MKNIVSIVLLALIFTSCSSDSLEDLVDPLPDDSTMITYKENVKSIIDQSCATSGCHNASTNSGNLTLENYTQVKDAFQNRNALGRMESTSNPMPPTGNLPSTTISTIKKWKEQGYID